MERFKLLIVEDEYDTLMFLNFLLGKKFDIETCRTDEEFYQSISKYSYDLILMDIAIRGRKDGLELTKEIKNSELYKNIPVLCVSAHALDKDKEKAAQAGVDKFLSKPVNNKVLLETINDMICVRQYS